MLRFRRDGIYYTLYQGRSTLWRWRLLLPLVIALVAFGLGLLGHWLGLSVSNRPMLLGEYGPDSAALGRKLLWQTIKSDFERTVLTDEAPQFSELPDVYLFVSQNDLDKMAAAERENAYVQNPERNRYKAFFRLGEGEFLECRLSSRGASDWHHRPDKPSLRLKFSRKRRSPGFQWLELQRMEDVLGMANWYPDKLGQELGVMGARPRHVRLFLNRKPLGLYNLNFRPGDQMAMDNKKLPGIFFKGDRLELDSLWTTPDDWVIKGDCGEAERGWFAEFLQLVAETRLGAENRLALSRYVNEEDYAKWLAISAFVGGAHADDRHNHTLYLSTYEGKLRPLIWDFNGLGILQPANARLNLIASRLDGLLLQDPRFTHERDRWLWKLVSEDRWTDILSEELEKLKPDLLADRHLLQLTNITPYQGNWDRWTEKMQGRIYPVEHSSQVVDEEIKAKTRWLQQRQRVLREHMEKAEVSVRPTTSGCTVAVSGNVSVRVTTGSGRRLLLHPGLAFAGKDLSLPAPQPYFIAAPLFYDLEESAQELRFENAITGQSLEPHPVFPQPFEKQVSFNPGVRELDPGTAEVARSVETVRLGPGEVAFTQDVVIPEDAHLVVQPGTHIKMAPGKSLFSRGRVTMVGTLSEPITISELEPDKPFGTIGLVGPRASGSRFSYLTVEGGSTARFGAVHFKGMFNVYSVNDVYLTNCTFRRNQIGDDLVNLALARVEVRACEFTESSMDALDLDGCEGVVEDCRFLECGNDGLDIMQARLEVRECRFQGCRDKGMSVGEECALTVRDCQFERCVTGLEFKDASRSRVVESSLKECGTAVRAYRKKWLLQRGGEAQLVRCTVRDCRKDLELDKHSRLWLRETPLRVPAGLKEQVSTEGPFELGSGPRVRIQPQSAMN